MELGFISIFPVNVFLSMLGVFAGKAITVFNGFVRFDHPSGFVCLNPQIPSFPVAIYSGFVCFDHPSGFVCLNPQIPSFPVSVYSGSLGLIKLISEGLQNG